jgi:electron transport complex protein RnfE
MKLKKLRKIFKDGLIDNNPTFIQVIGMCPTLATTTSVKNAIGMGLAATAVLICSNILVSLLRRFIPRQVRIAAFVVIISGFVSAVELLMKAYFYDLYGALGLFIPLIVVNCIILARAEAFASKNPVFPSAVDGLSTGLGFTAALTVIATVREILGNGTLFGINLFGAHFQPAIIFILPSGAFLTLGFLIAAVHKIKNNADDRKNEKAAALEAAERAAERAAQKAAEDAAKAEEAAVLAAADKEAQI